MHSCVVLIIIIKLVLVHCFTGLFINYTILSLANDVTGLKESEEKLKQQQQESARRENILVMRLATKEQEMQECTVSIPLSGLLFFKTL